MNGTPREEVKIKAATQTLKNCDIENMLVGLGDVNNVAFSLTSVSSLGLDDRQTLFLTIVD